MSRPGGKAVRRTSVIAAVAAGAILVSVQVLRNAAVADREDSPALAAELWPAHPAVLTDRALLAVAKAATAGAPVPDATRADVRRIAARAPLMPDPFVIEGAIAETEGRPGAEALLLAARARDPRSRGARYLLADRYFRTGRIPAGLKEMYVLVKLHERGGEPFVPALVAYARTPGAVPALRQFFAANPGVEAGVLSALAGDAANADLVLSLASNWRNPAPDWRPGFVSALASAGQYERAYAVWARFSGVTKRPLLFNPGFEVLPAPPPFNWAFPQSAEGVAEPDGKGGLSLLYYGRAKAVLASQLLLLPQGTYRLSAAGEASGGDVGALHWVIRCAAGGNPLVDIPVQEGRRAVQFSLRPDCPAQWLELAGIAGDMPQTSEMIVRDLRLERVPGP